MLASKLDFSSIYKCSAGKPMGWMVLLVGKSRVDFSWVI